MYINHYFNENIGLESERVQICSCLMIRNEDEDLCETLCISVKVPTVSLASLIVSADRHILA